MIEYRVVGIVDYGSSFKTEIIPKTSWCTDYLKALKEKERLMKQLGDVKQVLNGMEAFINTYKIETRE